LDNYITSYVEKDIVLSAGIQKQADFLKMIRLLAGRTAQLLNTSEISKEVGVKVSTIRDWISLLEKMRIICLVQPFSSNLSSRLVKTPKIYFLDTGLACRLQGWSEMLPMMTSPQFGHLFKNLVFTEIYKTKINFGKSWQIYFWRSRDGEEIDFLIEKENQQKLFIESKVQFQDSFKLKEFPELRKVFLNKIPKVIIAVAQTNLKNEKVVPISDLRDVLLKK
jgi:predicted AAA+ superfamily ATPase